MDAIATVTLTLGRNRRPGSPVAPNVPLGPLVWDEFQAEAIDLLREYAGTDDSWVEVHTGFGEWDGVREESAKVTLLDGTTARIGDLLTAVQALSARYDQDAIAVSHGLSVLAVADAVAA